MKHSAVLTVHRKKRSVLTADFTDIHYQGAAGYQSFLVGQQHTPLCLPGTKNSLEAYHAADRHQNIIGRRETGKLLQCLFTKQPLAAPFQVIGHLGLDTSQCRNARAKNSYLFKKQLGILAGTQRLNMELLRICLDKLQRLCADGAG